MKGRGIHQTRHYFATEMYAATKDLRATQVALAHSSSTMTEKYAHVVDQREKVNLVKPLL
jgi:integrase